MKNTFKAFLVIGALSILNITAQDLEEVIVTSSFVNTEISGSLHVVDGDEIDMNVNASLGEAIDDLLGVSSADETPNRSSIASPKLALTFISISSPSTTCNEPLISVLTNEEVTITSSKSCAVIFKIESAPITKNALNVFFISTSVKKI